MQAAVVSMLLMAGACGAGDASQGQLAAVVWASDCGPRAGQTGQSKWTPQDANGTIYYHTGCFGWAWFTPIWRIHSNQAFYPGNYAKPYDYREIFDYPWNGPRPRPPQPMGGAWIVEPAAEPTLASP
jgi:hypothetical protein